MVGPVDVNGEPLGGQVEMVWNVIELRHSIYRMFGAALFIDVGNVWSRPEDMKLSDIRVDSGAGLRVNSPLGILRLDCGVNLDRKAEEPRTKVFISMGQAF
jgi:outer membrane translocation and assembly module TamA